jgi:hypothetical protein
MTHECGVAVQTNNQARGFARKGGLECSYSAELGFKAQCSSSGQESLRGARFETMDPEIVFHRGIQRANSKYRGKQDFDRLPEAMRSQVQEVHKQINEDFQMSRLSVLTPTGHPNLYFDFAECAENNAIAFNSEGWAMIGITTGLLTGTHRVMERLSNDNAMLQYLGFEAIDENRSLARDLLHSMLFRFIATHEFGHHYGGHIGPASSSGAFQMREEVGPTPVGDRTEDHVLELEADAFAVDRMVRPILRSGKIHRWIAGQMFDTTEDDPELDERFAFALLTAIATYFQSVPQPSFSGENAARVLSHPPRLVRFQYLIKKIQEIVAITDSQFLTGLDDVAIDLIHERVLTVLAHLGGEMAFERQEEFVHSEAGQAYMQRLDDVRPVILAKYEPYAWKRNFAPIHWKSPEM